MRKLIAMAVAAGFAICGIGPAQAKDKKAAKPVKTKNAESKKEKKPANKVVENKKEDKPKRVKRASKPADE